MSSFCECACLHSRADCKTYRVFNYARTDDSDTVRARHTLAATGEDSPLKPVEVTDGTGFTLGIK